MRARPLPCDAQSAGRGRDSAGKTRVLHYGLPNRFDCAGRWFLSSGIQAPNGAVARYYCADVQQNRAASTEITGYAISALEHLHRLTGDARYRDRALAAARFLVRDAWRREFEAMPFETDRPALAYFFDCGIVVRGLLAAWRAERANEFLECAAAVGRSMARDFRADDGWHPVLALPEKRPLERDAARWSRQPGCYQLKAAMAWWDLYQAAGDAAFRDLYRESLQSALANSAEFLPGDTDRLKIMDRLHAYLYFLEGLIPAAGEESCARALGGGIRKVAHWLRQIEPEFARSDVYAQLLRIRMLADAAGAEPLEREAGGREACALAEFQADGGDRRIGGGFWFGRRNGAWLPHVSPVSAAFAIEALDLWERPAGAKDAGRPLV